MITYNETLYIVVALPYVLVVFLGSEHAPQDRSPPLLHVRASETMSSMNPFTRKREKKEEDIKERIEEYQLQRLEQQQQQQQQQPESTWSLPADAGAEDGEDRYGKEDFDKYLPASAKVDQEASFNYSGGGSSYEPPSRMRQCFSKLQSGFMIGGALGGAFGTLYGTYAAVVYKHILYLPIAVVQAGGAFGFFLACGTVIRCDEQQHPPLVLTSQELASAARPSPALAAAVARDPGYCAIVSAVLGA